MRILFYYKGVENLGIEYLSSYLKQFGHKTELIFDPGLDDNFYFRLPVKSIFNLEKRMMRKAKRFKPDLIAFSAITNLYPSIKNIAEKLKRELDVPTIVGGIHATALPEVVLKEKYFDMVCLGEGEEALLELVNSMETGRMNFKIKNIWFKKGNKIIRNPIRPLIQDLDSLPFPDKDIFYKYGVFKKRLLIMCSRGCPFSCTYCINNFYSKLYRNKGNYVRRRDVENVVEEVKLTVEKYGCNFIWFQDDIFPVDEKWLMKFKDMYTKEIGLPFHCNLHPSTVNEKNVKLLKESGCTGIDIGVQTANQTIRKKLLHTHTSNEQIIKAAKIINENRINLATNLIFGFPNETYDNMWNSFVFNKKLNPHNTASLIFYPFPKIALTEYCINHKMMNEKQVKQMNEGIGSVHTILLIKHPYTQEIMNFNALTPIFVKLPEFTFPLLKKIVKGRYSYIHKFLYLLSIPFTDKREFLQRLKDFPRMIYYTMEEYNLF